MSDDEEQIRGLIRRWAQAVHTGDLDAVLADHTDDMVMFDVPPPHRGLRGLEAYRGTWPPFFDWQASGAVFEIESLDVTAGADVAFAEALLLCGTPAELEARPDQRLRLTLGLRKQDGRWQIAHEHHSFADTTGEGEDELRSVHRGWFESTAARDLDGLMEHLADDVVCYEHDAPLQHLGRDAVRAVCANGLESAPGTITWSVPELEIAVDRDLAVAYGLNQRTAEQADGTVIESWSRGTRVFARREGTWRLIHQHLSYPHDPESGLARTELRP